MGDDITALLIALCLFLLGAVLASIEASLLATPEARMRALRDERGDPGGRITAYLADPTRVLTRLLAGRVFAPLIAMAIATRTLLTATSAWWHIVLVASAVAFFYGLLNLLAVTLGRGRAWDVAPRGLFWCRPLLLIFAPVAFALQRFGAWATRGLRDGGTIEAPPVSEREVEYVVEAAQSAGTVDPVSSAMLANVFEVKTLSARDVMVPRTRVVALEMGTSVAEALRRLNEEGHSRVPVFREQIDNVIGTLHAKDLYRYAVQRADGGGEVVDSVEALARRPAFLVSDMQPALSVLRDMQQRKTHLAVVVDEFGAMVGLITLEDVLEELVGEIEDEHDERNVEAEFAEIAAGRFMAAAAIPIETLGERLDVEFPPDGDYASLGGFLAARAGKVPEVGAVVLWEGLRFIIREGDKRRVTKVEIVRDPSRLDAN